ncbi:hypothetical protein ACSAZK_16985 [Methanosarcina sp. Mfa9]|uniref:hypothetical protein n=1 Tax=Methanosarcina sp. Mfa9 TaxID=3439063 RepID=UPI003F825FCB
MSVAPEIPYSAYEPMLNLILIFLFASLVIVFFIFTHARHTAKKRLKEAEEKKIERMKEMEAKEEIKGEEEKEEEEKEEEEKEN